MEQAVKLDEEILNRYSIAFDGLHDAIEPVNAADVDHLLDLLHKCLKKWIVEILEVRPRRLAKCFARSYCLR